MTLRRIAAPRPALDVPLDHDIVGTADEKQMLHVVPPQQDQLPLTIELVDVDDAEPRLAAALARPRRKGEAAPGQPHEQQRRNQEQHQDDDEDHQELQGERTVGTEERLQDPRLS